MISFCCSNVIIFKLIGYDVIFKSLLNFGVLSDFIMSFTYTDSDVPSSTSFGSYCSECDFLNCVCSDGMSSLCSSLNSLRLRRSHPGVRARRRLRNRNRMMLDGPSGSSSSRTTSRQAGCRFLTGAQFDWFLQSCPLVEELRREINSLRLRCEYLENFVPLPSGYAYRTEQI